jgi:succinate dehydrogenase / fumarate reductase, cytochrome b subunit
MRFFQSTIGLKILMALSGLVGVGFVVGHMLGNLQILIPLETGMPILEHPLNEYAASLHGNAALLWGARIVLLTAIVVHITTAVKLTVKIGKARPVKYGQKGWLGASYATRTMRMGGFILLAFIVYHLAHLTWGAPVLSNEYMAIVDWDKGPVDVYANVMKGFSSIPVALFYIIAQVMLGLHLTHGIHSMSRSLGLSNPVWTERAGKVAVATGIGITVGNIAIVLFGMIAG